MLWSPEEVNIFTSHPASINVLELAAVVVAIFENVTEHNDRVHLLFLMKSSETKIITNIITSFYEIII
jgi:hypothetical protein